MLSSSCMDPGRDVRKSRPPPSLPCCFVFFFFYLSLSIYILCPNNMFIFQYHIPEFYVSIIIESHLLLFQVWGILTRSPQRLRFRLPRLTPCPTTSRRDRWLCRDYPDNIQDTGRGMIWINQSKTNHLFTMKMKIFVSTSGISKKKYVCIL